MSRTPVAYIVFNRPEHTARTFSVLREQRPDRLFIIADGPRRGHPTDEERCALVRRIVDAVDWPCEVACNYAEANLGLKRRVSSGLDWVFEHTERAIVLEDDCVANPDFFRFCDKLLDHYADDERVAVVTGNNFQHGRRRGDAAYYFSKYNHCWGWATWRRAWRHYRGDLPFWPDWRQSPAWRELLPDPVEQRYWAEIFDRVKSGEIDSWAYPWTASVWHQGGLTATPNVNLVSNIGFGDEATHTKATNSRSANLPTAALGPIEHPPQVVASTAADRYVLDTVFGGAQQRFPKPMIRRIRRLPGALLRSLGWGPAR
jgi:hypothetical protein